MTDTPQDPHQRPHVLACDVGNTSVRLAHVSGDIVAGLQRLRVGELAQLASRLKELWESIPAPKHLVACSVNAAALKALEAAAAESIGQEAAVVGRDIPRPIDVDLDEPRGVGMDRLCAAVAAFDRLGTACVVADFGTAITIDCVNDAGVFLGGAILPGLGMSTAALHEHTSALPLVAPADPTWVMGRTTPQAIGGGVVYAARGALRELVEAYATKLGVWPTVIVTGADARLVCPEPGANGLVQAVVDDLVLRGVAMAHYRTLLG